MVRGKAASKEYRNAASKEHRQTQPAGLEVVTGTTSWFQEPVERYTGAAVTTVHRYAVTEEDHVPTGGLEVVCLFCASSDPQ